MHIYVHSSTVLQWPIHGLNLCIHQQIDKEDVVYIYLCMYTMEYFCCIVARSWPTLFVTPQLVTHQVLLCMGFPRQEYQNGLPFPSPGYLPDPSIEPTSPALQVDFFPSDPPGKPHNETLPSYKIKEIMLSAATWMDLEIIMRSEVRKTIPYDITYVQNIKHDANELLYKTKTDSQTQNRPVVAEGMGKGRIGSLNQQMQTIIYRMDKQQSPSVQHREVYLVSCNKS